jgi:hypothetical protein
VIHRNYYESGSVVFTHVYREVNQVANNLAKHDLNLDANIKIFEFILLLFPFLEYFNFSFVEAYIAPFVRKKYK